MFASCAAGAGPCGFSTNPFGWSRTTPFRRRQSAQYRQALNAVEPKLRLKRVKESTAAFLSEQKKPAQVNTFQSREATVIQTSRVEEPRA
jgi:hypothetical protein